MRKTVFIVLTFFIVLIPLNIFARETKKDKVNIYFFKRSGCIHCAEAEEFFTSIEEEYSKYYNLVIYDIYGNSENSNLMDRVSKKLKDNADGVPYIIIGKKSFIGYSKSDNESILSAIQQEYEKSEPYDIMKHLNDKEERNLITDIIVVMSITLVVGGILYIRYSNQWNLTNS